LCRPAQRKYDNAIATVFGRNMDAIVVEDEATAIECIRHMKEQHIPSATFLPLHSLSVQPLNHNLSSLVKGARHAIDLVKFDSQYEQVVRYACGNTVVCDNLNIAKTICFDMNESVRGIKKQQSKTKKNCVETRLNHQYKNSCHFGRYSHSPKWFDDRWFSPHTASNKMA
jgi:chromosome segregation ATPase